MEERANKYTETITKFDRWLLNRVNTGTVDKEDCDSAFIFSAVQQGKYKAVHSYLKRNTIGISRMSIPI
jgi:hypothetical protein